MLSNSHSPRKEGTCSLSATWLLPGLSVDSGLGSAPLKSRGPGHLLYGGQEQAGPAPDEEFVPKSPRPPGRPRTKRAYTPHRPFLAGERHTSSEGLCLRCRAYREPKDPVGVTLPNGRSARRGTCPVCGAAMVQIIKKD